MPGAPEFASHGLVGLVGVICGAFIAWPSGQPGCPDCVVNLSCPPVHCSTASIELSTSALVVLGCLLIGGCLIYWGFLRVQQLIVPDHSGASGKLAVVHGRGIALGASAHWRPSTTG